MSGFHLLILKETPRIINIDYSAACSKSDSSDRSSDDESDSELNSEGQSEKVVFKSTKEKSLWPLQFIVNEIDLKYRFKRENIFCAVIDDNIITCSEFSNMFERD